MRKLTLFSTLPSLWIFWARVSHGADGVPAPTAIKADRIRQEAAFIKERYGTASFWDRIRSASILFFDCLRFQGIPVFTSINPATWSPELLNTSKTKSAGVDVAWHHWSSNHYQQSPDDRSASPRAISVRIDSREN